LPQGFPSNLGKARLIAGRGLKRPPDELTFQEIVSFFEKRKESSVEI